MTQFLYRLRSTEYLLDKFEELRNQTIYLSSPQELNDPLEGYKDVIWDGDAVLWRNLFRHYILCLFHTMSHSLISIGAHKAFYRPKIRVSQSTDDLPHTRLKELCDQACRVFFAKPLTNEVLNHLIALQQPVRRDGILFLLTIVHTHALEATISVFQEEGLLAASELTVDTNKFLNLLRTMSSTLPVLAAQSQRSLADLHDFASSSHNQMLKEIYIIHQLNKHLNTNDDPYSQAQDYFSFEFPSDYVESTIETLIHAPWYTACFTLNPTNASMWGKYGDDHRGAALKFKMPETDLPSMRLHHSPNSANTVPSVQEFALRIRPVQYSEAPPTINFFEHLSQFSRRTLGRHWLSDENGQRSSKAAAYFDDINKWRNQSYDLFYKCATTKTADWAYEQEHRIVLLDLFWEKNEKTERVLRYDFSDLVGVVFGIRTARRDMLRIISTITEKCRELERREFEFWQASYSRASGKIELTRLSLLPHFNV